MSNRRLPLAGGVLLILAVLYITAKPAGPLLSGRDFSRVVTDRHGRLLRMTLSPDEKYRVRCTLADAGRLLREGVLLKEDRYFYRHPGVNPWSLLRAAYQTYVKKSATVGGSTITMQVARLRYGLRTRSVPGKISQIAAAFYLELYYSKDEIFEAYLSLAPCGGNIEGFAAASRIYFNKEPADLTLQEAFFLTVLPQKPVSRNPRQLADETGLRAARQRLFKSWIRRYPGDAAKAVHLDMALAAGNNLPFYAPHFVNSVLSVQTGTETIRTTLDLDRQQRLTRLADRYMDRKKTRGVYNTAALLVDARDMEVLASLGSADFFSDGIQGQVDGTSARRSPGSTLKPFIYALAMEQGLIHPMTILKDAPTSFSEYTPDNYQSDFKGAVSAGEALISSRNVPAVSLASRIHDPDLYGFLDACGAGDLRPRGHYGLSIVLGGAEFSMRELAALYGVLAGQGVYRPLQTVRDASRQQHFTTVLSSDVCYLTLKMLRANPRPGMSARLERPAGYGPVAYKTGTSIGFKDCWSIGIFEHYIIAVWLGNFDGYGNPEFSGRYLAAPLMFEMVDAIRALPDYDGEALPVPDGHIELEVCGTSGLLPQDHCRTRVTTGFIPGRSPITSCRICRAVLVDTVSGYRTRDRSNTRAATRIYEFWPTDLLKLFREAGLPRRTPPPFDPQEEADVSHVQGNAPVIMSPQRYTGYISRQSGASHQQLPLIVSADADVREVYWFIDDIFVGRAHPDQEVYWPLEAGTRTVCVIDDHGRSSYRRIVVTR